MEERSPERSAEALHLSLLPPRVHLEDCVSVDVRAHTACAALCQLDPGDGGDGTVQDGRERLTRNVGRRARKEECPPVLRSARLGQLLKIEHLAQGHTPQSENILVQVIIWFTVSNLFPNFDRACMRAYQHGWAKLQKQAHLPPQRRNSCRATSRSPSPLAQRRPTSDRRPARSNVASTPSSSDPQATCCDTPRRSRCG